MQHDGGLARTYERCQTPGRRFEHILPLCGRQPRIALDYLQRLRVVPFEEQELLKRVAQKTAQWIYRPDGNSLDPESTRRLLAEFIVKRLGQKLLKTDVVGELERHGFHLRVWAADGSLLSAVNNLNEGYLGPIRRQFINKHPIPRNEAAEAVRRLLNADGRKAQLILGTAGMGKSCVIVQIVERLLAAGLPTICLRLDNLPRVLTTNNLGRELGLPGSPAVVAAGIANGGNCVLVIDQLDALSIVSGRNDHLWPVFHLLLEEAGRIPNLRVLLACRAFDLHHDQRLRALTGEAGLAGIVELSLLEVHQVHEAVRAAGGEPERLSSRQLELLRTPFNLQLFLLGAPEGNSLFRSVKDLFDRFWDTKMALVAVQAWDKCIGTLAKALSRGATSAPIELLDEHPSDAKKMASHGVLVLENRRWRFFHESFGDYAFARQFAREGRDLIEFLTKEGEQHLYRRAQVRQILTYERDRSRDDYMRTLQRLVAESRVRLHIKKVALEWLSHLDDPGEDEWELLRSLLHHPVLGPHAVSVLWDRIPWFDLLQRANAWPKLLSDEYDRVGEQCVRICSTDTMMQQRSSAIAGLFAPHRGDPRWEGKFHHLFYFGRVEHSREMFELLLGCLDDGFFDDLDRRNDLLLHRLSENQPNYAAEFLGRYFDRLCVLAKERGTTNPFAKPSAQRSIRGPEVRSIAERVPLIFAEQMAPRLEKLIVTNELALDNGEIADGIWKHLTLGAEHDLDDILLFSTVRALQKVAADDPVAFSRLTMHWHQLQHRSIRFLLMSGWAGNGAAFADTAAEYLVRNPTALGLGYFMVIGVGDPHAAVSRALLQAISPHCSEKHHIALENAICVFGPKEKQDGHRQKLTRLALLRSLQSQRLSPASCAAIKQLEGEFPAAQFHLPVAGAGVFSQGDSPVLDLGNLSDEEWTALCRKCSEEPGEDSCTQSPIKLADLIRSLSSHTKAERRRFAEVAQRIDDDISPIFFSTILEALFPYEDSQKEESPAEPLDIPTLCSVIARVHSLPNHPCGHAISSVVYRIADKDLPVEIVDIVGYYAVHDPDPPPDSSERTGKDLVNHAINTVRGTAVDAMGRILFARPDLAQRLVPVLARLTRDPSPSIRAVTIHPLLALLNRDPDTAVRLFLDICQSDVRIWGSHHVEEFIFYATFTHYATLQSLLRDMLSAEDEKAKQIAAHQITMAAFRHENAESDLNTVLRGDDVCRRAAAEILAQNRHHISISHQCEKHLLPLLNDSNHGVRRAAEFWLHELQRVGPADNWTFFRKYLETEAFAEEPGICLHQLQSISTIPRDVVLRLAERSIELSKRDLTAEPMKAYRFAQYTPTLLVRLYHQTDHEPVKTRCLDFLDAMLALGWNEVAAEMAKAER